MARKQPKRKNKSEVNYGKFNIELAKQLKNATSDQERKVVIKKLVLLNKSLIWKIAIRFNRKYPLIETKELVNEGVQGFIHSLTKFEVEKGYALSTYSFFWIHQFMQRYIQNNSRAVRLPVHYAEKIRKFLKAKEELTSELQRTPTNAEIAARLEITPQRLSQILLNSRQIYSLDELIVTDSKQITRGDSIESPEDISQYHDKVVREIVIKKALSTLTKQQQEIVVLSFGLEDGKPRKNNVIGECLKLSPNEVRNIKNSAIRRLKIYFDRQPAYIRDLISL